MDLLFSNSAYFVSGASRVSLLVVNADRGCKLFPQFYCSEYEKRGDIPKNHLKC